MNSCFQGESTGQRTESIRQRILDEKAVRGIATTDANALITQYHSMKRSEGFPRRIRRGMRTRDRLAALRFAVDEFDLLAGRPLFSLDPLPSSKGGKVPDAEYKEAETFLSRLGPEPGQTGHCELDRSKAFELGLDALRASIDGETAKTKDEKRETYQAFSLALEGLSIMIAHAAETVEAAIPTASDARKTELRMIAESCRRIAREPPRSFMDALHLLWFIDMGVQLADNAGLAGPGHLDRTLFRFFENDLANS